MTMILGLSGRSQSGKTTIANWLTGVWMQKYGLIEYHFVDHDGDLWVPVELDGKIQDRVIKINRESLWLKENVYPHIKQYSFADKLKQFCISQFGCTWEQMYGTNEQKNEYTKIQWKGFSKNVIKLFGKKPTEYLTGRELLQVFGTNVVREIYYDAWVLGCLNQIIEDQSEFAIITDVRFPNEVDGISGAGGMTVRLLRNILNLTHESETALDPDKFDQTKFSAVLDNSNLTIGEQNQNMFEILQEWGWIDFGMGTWENPKDIIHRESQIAKGAMKINANKKVKNT